VRYSVFVCGDCVFADHCREDVQVTLTGLFKISDGGVYVYSRLEDHYNRGTGKRLRFARRLAELERSGADPAERERVERELGLSRKLAVTLEAFLNKDGKGMRQVSRWPWVCCLVRCGSDLTPHYAGYWSDRRQMGHTELRDYPCLR
jgi:hypothetical protein